MARQHRVGKTADHGHGGGDRSQPQFALQRPARGFGGLPQRLGRSDQLPRPGQYRHALVGQPGIFGVAPDQPLAKLRLQRGDACRKRGRSEEHTSELQSLMRISYAVFCLKKKQMTRYEVFVTSSNMTNVITVRCASTLKPP